MQRQELPPLNSEQQHEPDWELATYPRRMGAWALDFVGFALPLLLLVLLMLIIPLLLFPFTIQDPLTTQDIILTPMLAPIYVILIGYIIWWLLALRRGQTPGKQIVGIRVIKDDGSPSGWGYTFLREFVIKFLLVGFLDSSTFGIARLVDYLWPLWDRKKKMQTLHDKLLGTLVVRNR